MSNKEVAVFAGSIGFGLSYMIFKIAYEYAKNVNGQDVKAIRDFMVRYQVLVFLLYAVLFLIHLFMLYRSNKFVKNPVKENFDQRGWLVGASGTLWLFVAISLIMALFDGTNFLAMWTLKTGEALKFSCFFYWFYRVYNDPIPELSQYAVLWQIPMIIVEVVVGLHSYNRYYNAKKLFLHLYPNLVRTGIYNAFHSNSKNGNRLHMVQPEDTTDILPQPSAEETGMLQKPLGNNRLFSVDALPKEKNILKTQQEIDGEYEEIFSKASVPPLEVADSGAAHEDYEQELIPTEFDFSKMKLSPDSKTNNAEESESGEEKIACPMCGFLNGKSSAECEFCGAEIK